MKKIENLLSNELKNIHDSGLYKDERQIESAQSSKIIVKGKEVVNFCANNYLGLSSNQEVIKASKETLDSHGYGMSSVRFICGTQDIHKKLENKISDFLGMEDTILYAAAFDANGGVFCISPDGSELNCKSKTVITCHTFTMGACPPHPSALAN